MSPPKGLSIKSGLRKRIFWCFGVRSVQFSGRTSKHPEKRFAPSCDGESNSKILWGPKILTNNLWPESGASWTTPNAPFISDTSRLWRTTCAPIWSGGCFGPLRLLNPRRLKCSLSLSPAMLLSVLILPNLCEHYKIEKEHGSLTHLREYSLPSLSMPWFQCSICFITSSTQTPFWYSKLPIQDNCGGCVIQKTRPWRLYEGLSLRIISKKLLVIVFNMSSPKQWPWYSGFTFMSSKTSVACR